MCLEGYSSQASFMDLHSDVTAAWDILMPASIPVVDTLHTSPNFKHYLIRSHICFTTHFLLSIKDEQYS
jgi:hypothetical protein